VAGGAAGLGRGARAGLHLHVRTHGTHGTHTHEDGGAGRGGAVSWRRVGARGRGVGGWRRSIILIIVHLVIVIIFIILIVLVIIVIIILVLIVLVLIILIIPINIIISSSIIIMIAHELRNGADAHRPVERRAVRRGVLHQGRQELREVREGGAVALGHDGGALRHRVHHRVVVRRPLVLVVDLVVAVRLLAHVLLEQQGVQGLAQMRQHALLRHNTPCIP
jgi:hypothetical protein